MGKKPVWTKEFKLPVLDKNNKDWISFQVMDKDKVGDDDLIGEGKCE